MAAGKTLSFEESMARLDVIVKQLERGDAPLNQALGLFEEGAGLIKTRGNMLDKAEQRVTRLKKGPEDEPQESLFDEAE